MYPQPLAPVDTVRAKLARPMSSYTRAECAEIIGGRGVNYGALGHATPEELTDRLYEIVSAGKSPKRAEDVLWTDLETPAAYFARKAREARA